ncbi:MAG: hypothetical protein JXR96_10010 [Deltaproteobacteria bacterium]|nr:hypothetical protein [Deltaproteobacteria bacterium]
MSKETLEEMKQARKERGTKEGLTDLRKHARTVHKAIQAALGDEAKTAPEVARLAELDVREVFWHLNAMRKYGQAEVVGQDGSYLTYRFVDKES